MRSLAMKRAGFRLEPIFTLGAFSRPAPALADCLISLLPGVSCHCEPQPQAGYIYMSLPPVIGLPVDDILIYPLFNCVIYEC